MKISYTHELPMGHRLQYHEGRCRYLHGHNYVVTVVVDGPIDITSGFVADYSVLKKAVKEVLDAYDHSFVLQEDDPAVNSILPYSQLITLTVPPTAENLAIHWADAIAAKLRVKVSQLTIEVKETSSTSAVYEPARTV